MKRRCMQSIVMNGNTQTTASTSGQLDQNENFHADSSIESSITKGHKHKYLYKEWNEDAIEIQDRLNGYYAYIRRLEADSVIMKDKYETLKKKYEEKNETVKGLKKHNNHYNKTVFICTEEFRKSRDHHEEVLQTINSRVEACEKRLSALSEKLQQQQQQQQQQQSTLQAQVSDLSRNLSSKIDDYISLTMEYEEFRQNTRHKMESLERQAAQQRNRIDSLEKQMRLRLGTLETKLQRVSTRSGCIALVAKRMRKLQNRLENYEQDVKTDARGPETSSSNTIEALKQLCEL